MLVPSASWERAFETTCAPPQWCFHSYHTEDHALFIKRQFAFTKLILRPDVVHFFSCPPLRIEGTEILVVLSPFFSLSTSLGTKGGVQGAVQDEARAAFGA